MDNNKLDDLGERWEKETGPSPISFVEDIPIDRETAIIDLATLQRLADNLAEADIKDIVKRFVSHIEQITAVNSSIEKYVKLLDDESAFHKTVKSIVEHNKK